MAMYRGKSTYEFKVNLMNEFKVLRGEMFKLYARDVRIYYAVIYEAGEYGNISENKLKSGICKLMERAEWIKKLPSEIEVDEDHVMMQNTMEYKSKWLQEQIDKIEVGISSKSKRRRLEMFKLIVRVTIGDLNKMKSLDATEFVCEYEKKLIAHKGKKYKKL